MKQIVVIGCGRFGKSLALKLAELDQEVLVIDQEEDVINEISPYVTHAVVADVAIEGIMDDLGVGNFDVVVIGMSSNFEASILATTTAKQLGVKTVIVKAKDSIHGKILKKVGADEVIIPEKESGLRLAHILTKNNIVDFIELSDEFSMIEIGTPNIWANHKIGDLDIRNKHNISIIAVRDEDGTHINPSSDFVVKKEDVLLVVGVTENVEEIVNLSND